MTIKYLFYTLVMGAIFKVYNFQDILTYKLLLCKLYICAYLFDNEIKINVGKIIINQNETSIHEINETIDLFNDDSFIHNLILYDTDKSFYKILSTSKKGCDDIKCCAIYVKPLNMSENNDTIFESHIFDLKRNYVAYSFKKHKSYLTVFFYKFLLCGGGKNNI